MNSDLYPFKIDDQWQMLHLPEQPNGYGVFIIGDTNHFVSKEISLWTQNQERAIFIEMLLEEGYTVFYSNLYGHHWGSFEAVKLAEITYEMVIRRTILNESVHVIAEGMGALIALQLGQRNPDRIRSISLLNPCIDLEHHIKNEFQKRIFFKSLMAEISEAHHQELPQILHFKQYREQIPIHIWHAVNHPQYPLTDHARAFEEYAIKTHLPVSLSVQLGIKQVLPSHALLSFLKAQEGLI